MEKNSIFNLTFVRFLRTAKKKKKISRAQDCSINTPNEVEMT